MEITTCAPADFKAILNLYDQAIEYQKEVFDKHWQQFDEALIEKEIHEKRLWKILDGNEIACIFSVVYSDPLIWKEKDKEPALYIHRIVTNPAFRGRGFVKVIVEWARGFAAEMGKKFIRMDTWGDNQKLIDYYQACGFNFLGVVTPQAVSHLPKHYVGIELSLFEINLKGQANEKG